MIPEAAVEAAARVMFKAQTFNDWDALDPKIKPLWIRKARAAVEAAAPHMLATAWDEGEQAGAINHAAEEWPGVASINNPYRPTP